MSNAPVQALFLTYSHVVSKQFSSVYALLSHKTKNAWIRVRNIFNETMVFLLFADFLFSLTACLNLERPGSYSKAQPGFNQFAAILISQRSANLPDNQQQLAWPRIKSPPQPPIGILSNLSVQSGPQWQGLVQVPVRLPLASSEPLSPLLCREAKNVQALKRD